MPSVASFGLLESCPGAEPDRIWTPIEGVSIQNGCEGCADGRPVWFCDTIEHPNALRSDMICGDCASKLLRDVASAIQPVWFTVCEEGFIDQMFPIYQAEREK